MSTPYTVNGQRVQDEHARDYLLSLKAGVKPNIRPDVGRWVQVVDRAEEAYEAGTNGDKAAIVQSVLADLMKRLPELKILLSDTQAPSASPPPLSESHPTDFPALPDTLLLPAWARLPEGLSEKASPLMDMYIAYSKEISPEGYEFFHQDAFLSLLSTINAGRTIIPLRTPLRCPLVIVFVADTGDHAKTTTMKAIENVLDAVGLRFLLLTGKITPQRLVQEMTGIVPKDYLELDSAIQERIKNRLAFAGQHGRHYAEFGKMIRSMMNLNSPMADFQAFLLEMDDNMPTYENGTMARGTEIILKPYLAICGCATPSNFSDSGKHGSELWDDGQFPRMIFSCPPDGTAIDSPMELGIVPVPDELIQALRRWHWRLGVPTVTIEPIRDDKYKDTGRFKIDRTDLPEETIVFGDGVDDARKRYRSALKQLSNELGKHGLRDLKGSYIRLPVKALRVAALLASLENNGVISLSQWSLAQEISERWRTSLHEFYRQCNQSKYSPSIGKKLENRIKEAIEGFQRRGERPPTIRDLCGYIKNVESGKLKITTLDMVRTDQLVEDRTGKSPRYSIAEED